MRSPPALADDLAVTLRGLPRLLGETGLKDTLLGAKHNKVKRENFRSVMVFQKWPS